MVHFHLPLAAMPNTRPYMPEIMLPKTSRQGDELACSECGVEQVVIMQDKDFRIPAGAGHAGRARCSSGIHGPQGSRQDKGA